MKESLQDIIASAASDGWDFFKQADPKVRDLMQVKREQAEQDQKAIDRAWAEFARTPGGEKALMQLFQATLRRTVYFAQLGLDIQSMAVWGAFREGQNALAHEIARRIARGQGEVEPKPRDVT